MFSHNIEDEGRLEIIFRVFLILLRELIMAKKGIALNIGLNLVDPDHYSGWDGKLSACENDAKAMNKIAKSQGFEAEILLTREAKRDSVMAAIENAARKLVSGDMFLMSYSGHGGQMPDYSGDESDLTDETWCLYDGEILDDEFQHLWAQFSEGVRILFISDSCHSETVYKGFAIDENSGAPFVTTTEDGVARIWKLMPPGIKRATYEKNKDFYDGLARSLPANIDLDSIGASLVSIGACLDKETALDGWDNGLFTGNLLRIWEDGTFEGSYKDFHNKVHDRVVAGAGSHKQHPTLTIDGNNKSDFSKEKPFTL